MRFLVINGPNLNLTGLREKSVYGTQTLAEINAKIAAYCNAQGDSVDFFQSNIEGELINALHSVSSPTISTAREKRYRTPFFSAYIFSFSSPSRGKPKSLSGASSKV
jgi:hypothetical protein